MSERVELPTVPSWLAALPFLFNSRARSDEDLLVHSALMSAVAAMTADSERRDSRSRISFALAELGSQHARRTGNPCGWIPVTRTQLARAAGLTLTKVKRILGFLLLSRVIDISEEGIRVLDWNRLCKLASYDRRWAPGPPPSDEETDAAPPAPSRETAPTLTAAGDPATFV